MLAELSEFQLEVAILAFHKAILPRAGFGTATEGYL